jgi:DNA sulfur modification protein DndD
MDSPFGQLGRDFRKGIAQWIPDLAPQVVILVSNSQYEGAVEEILGQTKRVGKRYYLRYHGPSLKKDAVPVLTVNGIEYEQYREANEEMTEIVEIGM